MKYSETKDEKLRTARAEYVQKRWEDLSERSRDSSSEVAKYLFLVNSGGAIATLSFMGAMKVFDPIPGAPTMLMLFVLGLILVGVGRAISAYRFTHVFYGFRKLVTQYYADEIVWDQVLKQDAARSRYFVGLDVVAWCAFACFIGGVYIGFSDLSAGRTGAMRVEKRDQPTPSTPPPAPPVEKK